MMTVFKMSLYCKPLCQPAYRSKVRIWLDCSLMKCLSFLWVANQTIYLTSSQAGTQCNNVSVTTLKWQQCPSPDKLYVYPNFLVKGTCLTPFYIIFCYRQVRENKVVSGLLYNKMEKIEPQLQGNVMSLPLYGRAEIASSLGEVQNCELIEQLFGFCQAQGFYCS